MLSNNIETPTSELIEKYFSKIEEQQNYYKHMFSNSLIGMCIIDPLTNKFLLVNDSCCRIWNRTKEDLLSRTWQSITEADSITPDQDNLDKINIGHINSYIMAKVYLIPPDHKKLPAILEVTQLYGDNNKKLPYVLSKIIPIDLIRNWNIMINNLLIK